MVQNAIKLDLETLPYYGCCVLLTTKHSKSIALTPPFEKIIGAGVLEYVVDTDQLGTFSGEVERKGSALDCARRKCEWSIKNLNSEYALASEGSFIPHPFIPLIPSNRETLYFIDRVREFHLHVTDITTNTNYQRHEVSSIDDLKFFAEKALFPSHALIVRPFPREIEGPIFKGINNKADLEAAYLECRKFSPKNKVWIETDMRAHLNPTRMKFIENLGKTLALRLTKLCPDCGTPGWGKVKVQTGLPCSLCNLPTEEIKAEIYGCSKCKFNQFISLKNNRKKALPEFCGFCNP